MTLFKKVFQNQSRPATEGEGLDDAALRRAFLHSDEREPLNLDPFGPVEQVHEEDDRMVFQAVDELKLSDDFRAPVTDGDDEDADPHDDLDEADQPTGDEHHEDWDKAEEEADMRPVADEPAEASMDAETFADTGSDPEAEDVQDPTDEDITAVLNRAMAAEAPEASSREPVAHSGAAADMLGTDAEEEPAENLEPKAHSMHADGMEEDDPAPEDDESDFSSGQLALLGASKSGMPQAPAPETAHTADLDLSSPAAFEGVPAPAAGRAARRAGRVKTRLLGFNRGTDADSDPFDQACDKTATAQSEKYPVGWLVIVEGPGIGHAFSLFTGASMIGRGEDQVIRLDFGDNSISRQNHAAIAYDEEQNKFFIGHGGKSNIIRRNARPVLSTEELHHADLIRIGETTLRFVALCGSDFQWNAAGGPYDGAV